MSTSSEWAKRVRHWIQRSQLLADLAQVRQDGGVRWALGDQPVRPLAPDEIQLLRDQRNRCDDWSRVRVVERFSPANVWDCVLRGDVVLGRFDERVEVEPGITLPSGLYRSTLVDCVVGDNALVHDVRLCAHYAIGPRAMLLDCGSVLCQGSSTFGNGQSISVGIETGGREVAVFAEIDVHTAAAVACHRADRAGLEAYAEAVEQYAAQAASSRGVIGRQAVLRNTPRVRNCYVGPCACIDAATLVEESTLLSAPDEPCVVASGSCVTQSILQWGCEVTTMALVHRSVLTEHSHAERHGKVTDCIVGPNSGVAEGEATACLIGPFVGFHHQALLIAVLWPEGKGNVGYGANVGSNHTSKAPDQEFWPGEGAFLGLGVNIKYPADFHRAPYTIVASGVSTLPQKLAFPFSLINQPSLQLAEVSPAYNEILPAWVLSDNLYAVKRNEGKYRARNKARRCRLEFEVFRPQIVDWMLDAADRLAAIGQVKSFYTDSDISGLGKNFLLESRRQTAIDTYLFFARYYALGGLWQQVQAAIERAGPAAARRVLDEPSEQPTWEHQRRLLIGRFGTSDVLDALREWPSMLQRVAEAVEESKAKDDRRGARIIDDYADVHPPAREDRFVQQTWDETRRTIAAVQGVLEQLQADD